MLLLLTGAAFADNNGPDNNQHGCDYAIVISKATAGDPAWQQVVTALHTKHAARGVLVFEYDTAVDEVTQGLAEHMPAYTCIVATPAEAGRDFVAKVHQFTRSLDDDPYTDTLWGILTGFDAANALSIATHAEPLRIERVTSGTELAMDRVREGVWFSELEPNLKVVKPRDTPAERAFTALTTTSTVATTPS